jgi:hypothetical protein
MRVEDAAYSLLGLFDLNMPLLYGEEEKAFTRSQYPCMETGFDTQYWNVSKLSIFSDSAKVLNS